MEGFPERFFGGTWSPRTRTQSEDDEVRRPSRRRTHPARSRGSCQGTDASTITLAHLLPHCGFMRSEGKHRGGPQRPEWNSRPLSPRLYRALTCTTRLLRPPSYRCWYSTRYRAGPRILLRALENRTPACQMSQNNGSFPGAGKHEVGAFYQNIEGRNTKAPRDDAVEQTESSVWCLPSTSARAPTETSTCMRFVFEDIVPRIPRLEMSPSQRVVTQTRGDPYMRCASADDTMQHKKKKEERKDAASRPQREPMERRPLAGSKQMEPPNQEDHALPRRRACKSDPRKRNTAGAPSATLRMPARLCPRDFARESRRPLRRTAVPPPPPLT